MDQCSFHRSDRLSIGLFAADRRGQRDVRGVARGLTKLPRHALEIKRPACHPFTNGSRDLLVRIYSLTAFLGRAENRQEGGCSGAAYAVFHDQSCPAGRELPQLRPVRLKQQLDDRNPTGLG